MSEQGVFTLTCMEQVASLQGRRTCTDKREQVVMPASIIQEVCRGVLVCGAVSVPGQSGYLFVKQA